MSNKCCIRIECTLSKKNEKVCQGQSPDFTVNYLIRWKKKAVTGSSLTPHSTRMLLPSLILPRQPNLLLTNPPRILPLVLQLLESNELKLILSLRDKKAGCQILLLLFSIYIFDCM